MTYDCHSNIQERREFYPYNYYQYLQPIIQNMNVLFQTVFETIEKENYQIYNINICVIRYRIKYLIISVIISIDLLRMELEIYVFSLKSAVADISKPLLVEDKQKILPVN